MGSRDLNCVREGGYSMLLTSSSNHIKQTTEKNQVTTPTRYQGGCIIAMLKILSP